MDPRKVDVSVCPGFFLLEEMVTSNILTCTILSYCTIGKGSSPPLVLHHLYKISQVFVNGGVQVEINGGVNMNTVANIFVPQIFLVLHVFYSNLTRM